MGASAGEASSANPTPVTLPRYSFSYGFPTAAGATALPMAPASTMTVSTYGSMRKNCTGTLMTSWNA